jgi:DNA-binding transcriptional MerR regulator
MIEKEGSLKDTGLFNTGAFAKRADVTVRTLHYYDRMGLLHAHGRTPSGQRLYGSQELVRLQQILTLKFIGFQLQEIRRILDSPDFDLRVALLAQRSTITDKATQMRVIIRAIDAAVNTLG